jgi:hypothetical protein
MEWTETWKQRAGSKEKDIGLDNLSRARIDRFQPAMSA